MDSAEPQEEISNGERFAFGENWRRFIRGLTEQQIQSALATFTNFVGSERAANLHGSKFIDVGSGSGLSSLVAHRLGAVVHSFDYDPESVACTQLLHDRYRKDGSGWRVEQGSILDRDYVASLGHADLVYSWGVLHHTGQLGQALQNTASLVAPGGHAFIAIYNDQGWISRYWSGVKKVYNSSRLGQGLMVLVHLPYLFILRWVIRALSGRLKHERGMSLWWDMLDWLGGYPFEVATPEHIKKRFVEFGFEQVNLKTCGRRHGCNEYLFRRN